MGAGSVFKTLVRLSVPAMISMFFETLYSLIDTIFVAKLGTIPLAGMSLAVPFLFIGMALSKGVAIGSLALMSHARGSNRHGTAEKIAASAFPLILLFVGVLVLLALPTVNRPIFALFDNHSGLINEADHYTRWLALSFPSIGFTMLCEAIFFSYGDTKTPMQAMIAGNILNIILDPLLIFYCKMGVAGASFASLLGWTLSGFIMWQALKKRNLNRPRIEYSRDQIKLWPQIISLGIPVTLSMLIIPISIAVLNYLLAGFGPAYVGAWNMSTRIERMVVMPLYGISSALIPFVAFNLGLKRPDRIRTGCKTALLTCYILIIPTVLFFWFYAGTFIAVFKPSPEVLNLATFALKIAGLGYFFTPFELILTGLAQGLKQPKYSLLTNILRLLVIRLPLAFLFAEKMGGHGIYISHPVSLTISGIASFFLIRHLFKEQLQEDLP